MSKKSTSNTNTDVKEFKFEGENGNVFTGRIYEAKEVGNNTVYPLSLTINGLAVVGAKLWDNKKTFISMPEYKDSKGDYHSICYFYEKNDIADMNALAEYLKTFI